MTYTPATWLADVLRAAGLEVIEYPGWKARGLGDYRPFEPEAVVWHHDASPVGDSPGVPAYMVAHLANAGAQLWVDRQGRWTVIAAGRMPHTGNVLPGKPDNEKALGVETDHTTGEPWPKAQKRALRRGTAAILLALGASPGDLHFHSTICDPPGRKIDPFGLVSLAAERRLVAREMKALTEARTLDLFKADVEALVVKYLDPIAAKRPTVRALAQAVRALLESV